MGPYTAACLIQTETFDRWLMEGLREYGDMLEEGILDPAKVTRLALQNAASVAGLLLTTEVMIAEAPKDEEHRHGAPGHGRDGRIDM